MALVFEEFSTPAADPGRWFPYQQDGVACRVRRMPSDEANEIEAKITAAEEATAPAGENGTRQARPATQHFLQLRLEEAIRAWMDCVGFAVAPQDDAEATFYTAELQKPVAVGEEVSLDGRLTEGIKRRLLTRHISLMFWITSRMDEQEKRYRADEALLRKNSSPGSASERSSLTSPPSDARPAASPAA